MMRKPNCIEVQKKYLNGFPVSEVILEQNDSFSLKISAVGNIKTKIFVA